MTAENFAILGARGQIGREVRALAASRGLAHRALAHGDCDITDLEAVERAIAGCDVVVNCAGYTRVDQAEADPRAAFHVNTTGRGRSPRPARGRARCWCRFRPTMCSTAA